MRHVESKIQISCVNWFRWKYPHLRLLLFSVPNGGARNPIEGQILKAEGVVSGVADLLLLYPNNTYHGLCIEMKTMQKSSQQRPSQKEWQKAVEQVGYKYVICRTVDHFMQEVTNYVTNAQNIP